ncbi:alpha/beta fold hydrolase [Actinomycetospora termitidis]|uniref:Alpha/beta hydrolase n=1 Tax=Actinomycetospora termitidis TaxID=3053470 RepID=A0ABT7MJV6_9PSEU|nr:alpha/beta fold hydrolase [Actinomycetospora sp. Odt1-22]MDL5160202.1 alpha/beta hydrolase [Actinomycetospora sp. Odt1-22]
MRWSPPGWNAVVGLGLATVGRAAVGYTALRHRSVGPDEDVTHPGRGAVVLLGGLCETGPCLEPLGRWLTRLGYDVTAYTLGAGMGCAQRTVDSLVRRVRAIADETGQPVRIVGHSRGGQFGRAVGAAAPDAVAQLITIGTPFDRVSPPMTAVAWGMAVAGTVGVPGLFGLECLLGRCCAGFRDSLRAPWPDTIPFTSIYSRTDAAVPWRSSHDAYARNVVVPGGHIAQLTSAAIQRAVAEELAAAATPEGDRAIA